MKRVHHDRKMAEINLSTGKIITRSMEDYNRDLLGGRGVNYLILLKEMELDTSCFDPDNVLMFGTGSLVGTDVPGANRINIASRNCFNRGIGSASAGGDFAPQLRFAGYDCLKIVGKAEKPVYIWISDNSIKIMDADPLWGKGTEETDTIIKEIHGDQGTETARIGPAGENLSRQACVIVSRGRAAGRCGLGAVMGSKNLKAIAARGSQSIEIANRPEFQRLINGLKDKFLKSEQITQFFQREQKVGTLGAVPYNTADLYPGNNFQDPNPSNKLFDKDFEKYIKGTATCFKCPVQCAHTLQVQSGTYSGTEINKMEANSIVNFSARLGIDSPEFVIKAHNMCQRYGLDVDNTSGVIAWAFECYQRGLINKGDTGGLELNWGDQAIVLELMEKIAYRKGIGDLLAEGCLKASRLIGEGSEQFCIHVKGQELYENLRAQKGWALGVVVSERAGGHTRGAPLTEQASRVISPEKSNEIWGIPNASDTTSYSGKASLVSYFERFHAVLDSLGICYLVSNWTVPDLLGPQDCARLMSATTGHHCSSDEIMKTGEKIHTIGKLFNTIHAGFRREDDYPPKRMMNEPVQSGEFKGEHLPHSKWDTMLDEYYEIHGWDKETSWPTEETLKSLDLEEFVDDLRRLGRLPRKLTISNEIDPRQ